MLKDLRDYVEQHPLAGAEELLKNYSENPGHETLKKLTLASIPYLLTEAVHLITRLYSNYLD